MKIGAITIGQAPRVDVTCDIMDIFGLTLAHDFWHVLRGNNNTNNINRSLDVQ